MASVTKSALAAGMLAVLHPGCPETLDNVSPVRKRNLENKAEKLIAEIESFGFEVVEPA